MGFFDTLFGGGAQEDAAAKNAQALSQYGNTANSALTTGYNAGTGYLNNAIGAYAPVTALGNQYNQAGSLALNAMGVNGPQAAQTAQASFVPSAGYQLSEAAGEDAINRQRGAGGMFNSGNANEDLLKFGQNNLYGTQYAPWLAGLQSAGNLGAQLTQQGAAGTAAGNTAQAGLATGYGQDQSGVAGNIASGTVADNNMVAAGQAAGAKNLLGAGLSLATLGMGGNPFGGSLTGGGGGGGGFSNSLFGQIGSGIGTGFQNLNLGQGLFGGGTPSGY